MKFAQAKVHRFITGKYAGQTLDQVATSNDGLLFLDWLRAKRQSDAAHTPKRGLDAALIAYLDDPTISQELARAIDQRKQQVRGRRD